MRKCGNPQEICKIRRRPAAFKEKEIRNILRKCGNPQEIRKIRRRAADFKEKEIRNIFEEMRKSAGNPQNPQAGGRFKGKGHIYYCGSAGGGGILYEICAVLWTFFLTNAKCRNF